MEPMLLTINFGFSPPRLFCTRFQGQPIAKFRALYREAYHPSFYLWCSTWGACVPLCTTYTATCWPDYRYDFQWRLAADSINPLPTGRGKLRLMDCGRDFQVPAMLTCMGYARRLEGCTMTLTFCLTNFWTWVGPKGALRSHTDWSSRRIAITRLWKHKFWY